MQIRHQLGIVAMRGDQIIRHVIGMTGRVAQAVQTIDFGKFCQQTSQRPAFAVGSSPW